MHIINSLRGFNRILLFEGPLCKPYFVRDFNRHFSVTIAKNSFFEWDKRGGFEYPVFSKKTWQEHIRDGRKIFFEECKLFLKEIDETFHQDRKLYQDGDSDVFFRFDSEDCLKKWRVSSDKSNREGNSTCSLEINDKGKGVFYGNIDTTPPKDGKNRFAGYCAMKTLPKMKSFLREDVYDWTAFTHLELRVKGDGRNYAVHLGIAAYFDVSWFDMYTYTLHTHGGPYWQVIRIPFSRFYLTSKGRIQDKQCPMPLYQVNTVCILAAGVPGPFRLEIDYIGCHVDHRHKEIFAYELYKLPKEYVSS
ncbi:complex I intermediate-associated protein 30, mitochondrial-like [Uloborus diversus]|uniref:complex I intermediate-associated protein 30, mitochondrial-like n=1 Tax=Uloborus diversus TaxID=327109 RepID=UPI0024090D99|nr:complex I intermediate-associated protein 30, mitochondrial-like [Uloborus diversus]